MATKHTISRAKDRVCVATCPRLCGARVAREFVCLKDLRIWQKKEPTVWVTAQTLLARAHRFAFPLVNAKRAARIPEAVRGVLGLWAFQNHHRS